MPGNNNTTTQKTLKETISKLTLLTDDGQITSLEQMSNNERAAFQNAIAGVTEQQWGTEYNAATRINNLLTQLIKGLYQLTSLAVV